MSWKLVLVLSVGSYLLKVTGLMAFSGRTVPGSLLRFAGLLPPAILMALIVAQTVGGPDGQWVLDARLAGLGVAGVAVWRGAPFIVVVLVGAATAALLRAVL